MKRRTIDLLTSLGGLGLAILLLIGGLVLTANATFANTYVADQLSQQKITFKTADTLTDEEKQQACLVTYAGQPMTTGKQAECYANNFIAVHLKGIAGGKTYAELGDPADPAAEPDRDGSEGQCGEPGRPAEAARPTSPPTGRPCSRVRPCAGCC